MIYVDPDGRDGVLITLFGQECIIATFTVDVCCDKEVPIGTPPSPPGDPTTENPDLFLEEITWDGLDISRIEYGSDCLSRAQRHDFTYDANHRVTIMKHTLFPGGVTGLYNTNFIYDFAGNIMNLNRNGRYEENGGHQFGQIDQLVYSYADEQLSSIRDNATEPAAQPKGFRGLNAFGEYYYDQNGNLVHDSGKKLDIFYNVLNLPRRINTDDQNVYMLFDYTFSGEKIRQRVVDPSGQQSEVRTYLGGMEYVDGQPEAYYHSEGRVLFSLEGPPHLQYQITGHLGNLAVLFEDKDNDGWLITEAQTTDPEELEVLQRHFYYPFGMGMEGGWELASQPENRHQYNGKELLKDLGLGWYAYGFRL